MIRINLLKPEKKEIRAASDAPPTQLKEIKEKKRQPFMVLIFPLVAIAIAALFILQKKELTNEQNRLDEVRREKKSLEYVLVKLDELDQQKEDLQRKINLITELKSRQGSAVIIMDELSKSLPEWVWLTEASFAESTVRLSGRSISNNLLADYIFNLKESPYFSNINLISSTQRSTQTNQYLEFSLTARYFLPPPPEAQTKPAEKGEEQ